MRLKLFRFQERMRLSRQQVLHEEDMHSINFAFTVWEADDIRSKLEQEKAKAQSKAKK